MRKNAFFPTHDEHGRKLQPFGRVQRHHHHLVVASNLVGVRHQRHFFQKVIGVGKLFSSTNKFFEVLDAPLCFVRVFVAQLGQISAALQQLAQHVGWAMHQLALQLIHQLEEFVDATQRRPANTSRSRASQSHRQRETLFFGQRRHFVEAGVANATFGRIDSASNAHFVSRVHHTAQICHGIFHFFAVIKLGATNYAIRNITVNQEFFNHTALCVGAIKNCNFAPVDCLVAMQPL